MACGSSPRSRTSAPASRVAVLIAPAGSYFTACKPGMVGDGIRRRSRSPTPASPSARPAARRCWNNDRPVRRLREGPDRPLLAKTKTFAEPVRGGQGRRGTGLVRGRAHPLGRTSRSRVVRRSRPEWTPASRPRAGPEVDRLAPDREGPVAAEGYTLTSAERKVPRTTSSRTPRSATGRGPSSSPPRHRQRRQGFLDEVATGKVTGRVLVGHRPVHYPTSTVPGRLADAAAAAAAQGRGPRRSHHPLRRLQLLDGTGRARGSSRTALSHPPT